MGIADAFIGGSIGDLQKNLKDRVDEFGRKIDDLKPYLQKLTASVDTLNHNIMVLNDNITQLLKK